MKHLSRYLILLILGFTLIHFSCKKQPVTKEGVQLPFAGVDELQVDSLLNEMDLQEKIGQLIIWSLSKIDSSQKINLYNQVAKGRVGGVKLYGSNILDYLLTVDSCRSLAPLPLFFASSEKVSLHNQFSELVKFPSPVTVGTLDSMELEKALERHYLNQILALGINLAFQPTIREDNPDLATFDYGVFGGRKYERFEAAARIFHQLRKNRILTVLDGFSEAAIIENDSARHSRYGHLFSFTNEGLGAMLIDDEVFNSDTLKEKPQRFLKKYLNHSFNFNGLIVTNLGRLESPSLKVFHGADLFLTGDAQKTFYSILKMIERGRLSEKELDKKVKLVLMAKSWIHGGKLPPNIHYYKPIGNAANFKLVAAAEDVERIRRPITNPGIIRKAEEIECYLKDENWNFFIRNIFEKSVVLVNNPDETLPLSNSIGQNFVLAGYSEKSFAVFQEYFGKYAPYELMHFSPGPASNLSELKLSKPLSKPVIVVLLDKLDVKPGFHKPFLESLEKLSSEFKVVFVNFGNPKNLRYISKSSTLIQAFERNALTEAYIAQLLFGGVSSKGKLPVAISTDFPSGTTIANKAVRLGYSSPLSAGIAESTLAGVHAIVETAINNGVFPGCQVLFAKDGKIIFSKSFGAHTYKENNAVLNTDLYDLASVTKVAATTLAVMKLAENGKIDLQRKLGHYLPLENNPGLSAITIEALLRHTSGLQRQMPIASLISSTSVPNRGCNDKYCRKKRDKFTIQVAKGVYLRNDQRDSVWAKVFRIKPSDNKRYLYSDVNFFLLQKVVEEIVKMPLDIYVQKNFYNELGLYRTSFNPLSRFDPHEIVPTENDRKWRKTQVQGFVHDPAASIMGGVGGNAGVFSNAGDLASLFQMLLNKGFYGREVYLKPETVDAFISYDRSNRRGLGFDMPAERRYPAYSRHASKNTFGHTGFTGTSVWIDPDNNSIFVFLSNRVYPSVRNGKIFSDAIRSRIHSVFYNALGSYSFELPELKVTP